MYLLKTPWMFNDSWYVWSSQKCFRIWYKPWNKRSYFHVFGQILSTEWVINELVNRWWYPLTWRLHPTMVINFLEQILPMLNTANLLKEWIYDLCLWQGKFVKLPFSADSIKKILYYYLSYHLFSFCIR